MMKPQKKPAVANTTTFITGSCGKFFSDIKYNDDPGLMNIIDLTNLTKEPNRALDAVLNDSGDAFASVDTGGHLTVFYLLKNRYTNICKDVYPTSFCFAEKNEGLLFLAMPNKNIRVYNQAGKQLQELKGHKNTINGVKVSHARNLLLSYSSEACILWDLTSFKIYRTFHSKRYGYSSATFAPDGDALITFTQDSVITFFSISNSEVEKKFTLPSGSNIKKLAISVDSRYLAAVGNCPFIYIFDLNGSDNYTAYQLPSGCESVKDLKFIDKSRLVLLGGDNQIHCVDLSKDQRILLTKNIKGRAIISFDVNVRGKYLVTVASSGEIYLYDLAKLLADQESARIGRLNTVTGADAGYLTLKLCDTNEILEATSKTLKKRTKGATLRSSISPGQSLKAKTQTGFVGGSDTFAREGGTTILMGKTQSNYDENRSLRSSATDKENLSYTSNAIKSLFQTAKLDMTKSKLNKPELESFLKRFKVFPEKHRPLIWRTLLDLPLNNEAFDNLIAKGTHMAFHNLQDEYPIISNKVFTKLQRVLSSLAHYCPVFGEVEFLPDLIFPFIKLFGDEEIVCFEIALSFFMQWGQHFLESHPNPPTDLIGTVEGLLAYHEPELSNYLKDKRINIKPHVWFFLRTTFTDILTKQDWLSLMDFLVLNCHDPLYIVLFIVSYFSQLKSALFKTEVIEDAEYFIKKQSSINMPAIIDKMQEYMQTTDSSVLLVAFKDNLPLSGNQYPFFSFYPKHSLEQRRKIKEEIMREDHRLFTQKEQNKEIQRLAQEVLNQENRLKEKKESLTQAEKDRRDLKAYEEDMRLQQKLNIERESRERRANQMKELEKGITETIQQQELARTAGLKELSQDMQIKAKIDNHMIQSRLEEEALLNLEFTTAQKLNDIIEARKKEEKTRDARLQVEHQERQNRLKEIAYADALQKEEEEHQMRLDILKNQKLIEQNLQQETQTLKELTYQRMMEELERESKTQDLERKSRLRRIAGEGVDNNEFTRLYQKHEQTLKNEEEAQLNKILDEERKLALTRAEERLSIIDRERRLQKTESLNFREMQKTAELVRQKNDFEERLMEVRRQTQLRDLEEEKRLQSTIMEIEEENRRKREEQQDYLLRQKEMQAREDYQRFIQENEEQVLREEGEKFKKFKEEFDEEIERVNQSRNRDEYSRSYEASSVDRNNTMTNQTDDFRRSQQSYNNQRYLDETQRSEDRRTNDFERSQGTRSNLFRSQEEVKIEDQARREEGQRTGTFQSPNSSKRNFGQSVSFYTYSDTANEDDGRRYESSYRGNREAMSQAQQILSRHQQSYPSENVRQKYYAEDESRQPYSSTEMYQNNQGHSMRNNERSPDRFYQAKSGGSSRGQTLQSSPDLTYSSHEGSAEKGWNYGYEEH